MVSVVVPTYNSARFIAQTLETVTSQTQPPAEIIIVDGGSTDDTLSIAARFDVKISPEQSRNIPGGRNIGMRAAKSEWVALVDHDDLWEPTKLERQIEAIKQFPEVRMVLTEYLAFTGEETTVRESGFSDEYYRAIGRQEGGYFPGVDFTDREWLIPLTSSCLIRNGTEWFDEELQGTDDAEFFLRMMTYPFVLIDVPLARWRISPNNYSGNGLLMEIDFVRTMNKIMQRPEKYPTGVFDCVRRIRKERMRHTSLGLLRQGRVLASLSMFAKSFSRPLRTDSLSQ